uniref:Uncharacterized protein n=1 Tax=Heterorhabditis bacteriophora TaxID=37862 RepID=A0A1I7X1A4_HETBA
MRHLQSPALDITQCSEAFCLERYVTMIDSIKFNMSKLTQVASSNDN